MFVDKATYDSASPRLHFHSTFMERFAEMGRFFATPLLTPPSQLRNSEKDTNAF